MFVCLTLTSWANNIPLFGFGVNDTIFVDGKPVAIISDGDTIPMAIFAPPYGLEGASTTSNGHPLYLSDPDNVQDTSFYNPTTGDYTVSKRIGNLDYTPPSVMSFDEYFDYRSNRSLSDYWREKQRAERFNNTGGNSLLNLGEKSGLFGKDFVSIKPQGSAELIFGLQVNQNENPAIPVRDRTQTTFNFDMKIQMNVVGTIGDKLKLGTSYNTESNFDFENQMKLEYVGEEDEIIKTLEAGNVTLPLNSSLIQGSQSLFGLKSEMQFGRMRVTSVISQQRGETENIEISGGALTKEFEIRADDYEANKHFFITHAFKDNYDQALRTLPFISSQFQITQIEVWTTNTSFGNVENARNILALADLGTSDANMLTDPSVSISNTIVPSNESNNLYQEMVTSNARSLNNITQIMASKGYEEGVHYNKIENARKLSPSEYSFNPILGYISLNRTLNNDEVIGVAVQYTYNGEVYQIGDLSTNSNDLEANEALFLKLLKSTQVNNTEIPIWELMMKNVYALGEYNIKQESFQLDVLYQDPERGNFINYIPEDGIDPKLFIQITGSDKINKQGDAIVDGIFDFIDGVTIDAASGRIFFPVREPFGANMRESINNDEVASKYAFDSLYSNAQIIAQINFPDKNRFFIKGSFESSSSSEISLNAMNVPEGSVSVTAGGVKLTENIDYTVDYTLGRVKILNQGILNSGTPINISLESNSLFAIQSRTMIGSTFDYEVNRDLTVGGTIMNLTERPITFKVNIGDEPISNTVMGLNANYRSDAPYITRLVDMIPFIDTKEESNINIRGEYAKLFPGSPRAIREGGGGVSYIDDFEGAQTRIDMKAPQAWFLASTPQDEEKFPEGLLVNNLASGFNRAKLAWYDIDQLFTGNTGLNPDHIKDNPDHMENNYIRNILETEIAPNKELPNNTPANMMVLDFAIYPNERGPYNYDVDGNAPDSTVLGVSAGVAQDGTLVAPETRWAGVMRRMQTIDFQSSNIEFIELWMMDPFDDDYDALFPGYSAQDNDGGDIYVHLGNVSEDILRDSRKSFENGNPADGSTNLTEETTWGRVASVPALVNAFDNNPSSRPNQDVGLDGLSSTEEQRFFQETYLDRLIAVHGEASQAYQQALQDPSSDDYHYFLGDNLDADQVLVHDRYKNFNGLEGNSPTDEQSAQQNDAGYPTSATTLPDVEDINLDQTLSESESYYEYKISIRKEDLVVGRNHVAQILNATAANGKQVKWYQFKIPISSPNNKIGNIQDFRSIRFMRMVMTNFSQPTICRFGRFDLVRGEWRRYEFSMMNDGEFIANDELSNTDFDVSAVNIEDNAAKTPIPYVLPPGINREINAASANLARQNEQSLLMQACGLQDGDARAVFKNLDMDMRAYGRLKMFVHAEEIPSLTTTLQDGEVTAFIRIGSDFDQNYYEYEIPLKITDTLVSSSDVDAIWPEENAFDFEFSALTDAKTRRLQAGLNTQAIFSYVLEENGHKVYLKGNPNLASVRVVMLGIRNPLSDGEEKCAEVWFNELRLTDFYDQGGWAATASVTSNLADLGQLSLSGFMSTPGWGSIEKKVSERQRETIQQFDGTASLQLGKFFPEKSGIKVPMFASYSRSVQSPEFNPIDPDVSFTDDPIYDSLRTVSQTVSERRSINFSNVKKVRTNTKRKPQIYDIENFDFTYAYNEQQRRDINTEFNTSRNYRAAVNYNYNNKPKNVRPFSRTPLLRSLQKKIISNYQEKEKELRTEIAKIRKDKPNSPLIKELEEEMELTRERRGKFKDVSNDVLRSPWMRPIKSFNFYYLPSKISVRGDLNRTFNETKARNTTDFDILLDTNFNKNFTFNRVYDVKFDLAKGIKMDFQANNQARVDEPEGRIDDDWERDEVRSNLAEFGRTTGYHQTFNLNYTIPINQFPITDWVTANARYSANYDWQAAPLAIDSLGNTIQNSNSIQISSQANLTRFYNKIDYLKGINDKYRRSRGGSSRMRRGSSTQEEEKDSTKKDDLGLKQMLEYSFRTLMMLKNVSVTYSQTNGTFLPGYQPSPMILGNDLEQMAPGLGFVFGRQENALDFQQRVWDNQWLVGDTTINSRFARTFKESYNGRATIEPFPKFRIELTADRTYTESYSEVFRADGIGGFNRLSPTVSGSFSTSLITWRTSWEQVNEENGYESEAFNQFLGNRFTIARNLANSNDIIGDELTTDTTDYPIGYGPEHQEVLLLSFLSAYTGAEAGRWTDPFLTLPRPNWRINYNALSSLKSLEKYLQSMQVGHAYRSSFAIGSFNNNLNYDFDVAQNNFNGINQVVTQNIVNVATITEQFSPLMKVDMKWRNNLITKMEMRRDRSLSMSLSSKRLTEIRGREFVFGTGYVFKGVELAIKLPGGETKRFKSDLDVRVDLSVRNNLTITRQLDGVVQPTAGQRMVTLKTSADYQLSERLVVRAFFDRVLNDPVISNSFRNVNSNGGMSIRFNLGN